MPFGIPKGARCVQRFDDSLNSAIHITYRNSLRSSSMREPRDPLLKVVLFYWPKPNTFIDFNNKGYMKNIDSEINPSLHSKCTGGYEGGSARSNERPATSLWIQ
jgi:hypothetical protein